LWQLLVLPYTRNVDSNFWRRLVGAKVKTANRANYFAHVTLDKSKMEHNKLFENLDWGERTIDGDELKVI